MADESAVGIMVVIIAVIGLFLFTTHGNPVDIGQQHNVISDYFEYTDIEEFTFTPVNDKDSLLVFLRPTSLINGFNNKFIYRPVAVGHGILFTKNARSFDYHNDGIKISLVFTDTGEKVTYRFNDGNLYQNGNTNNVIFRMNTTKYSYDYNNLLISYFKKNPSVQSIVIRKCNTSSAENDPYAECASSTSAFTIYRSKALDAKPVFDGYHTTYSYVDGDHHVIITETGVTFYRLNGDTRVEEYIINFMTGQYGVSDKMIDTDFTPIAKPVSGDLYVPIKRLEYYRLGSN